ncbi:MAG: NlpC/P60 family protein [Phycisphaerales bacterium]
MDLSDLINLKFVDRGLDPVRDGGVDCWGLARLACRRLVGITLPEDPAEALMGEGELVTTCVVGEPRPGDILLFNTGGGNKKRGNETLSDGLGLHVGVCIDRARFIQILEGGTSHLTSIMAYRSRIVRRVRLKQEGTGHRALGTGKDNRPAVAGGSEGDTR